MTVKALESPKHLYGWFTAKGYKNLVLRIADLLQVPMAQLAVVDDILHRLNIGGAQDFSKLDPLDRIKTCCPTGYLTIEIELLFSQPWCDMDLLIKLQEATLTYREIRRRLGYPERVEDCDCGGAKKCRMCGGKGYTRTLLEMSEEEQLLAHGG